MAKWKPEYYYNKNKKIEGIKPVHSSKSQRQTKWKNYSSSDTLITYGEFVDYIQKVYHRPNESIKLFKHIHKLNGVRNVSFTKSNLTDIDIFNDYKNNTSYYHESYNKRNDLSEIIKNRPNYSKISWHFKYHTIRTIGILFFIILIIYLIV